MKTDNKPTLVIGASPNPRRYSHSAVIRLTEAGHTVYPLGIRDGAINGINIIKGLPELKGIHTITLYISAQYQPQYYDYIISLKPERIIFNPGTSNHELRKLAAEAGIKIESDCTLVMIAMGQY